MTGKPTREQSSEQRLEPKPLPVSTPTPFQIIVGFSERTLQEGLQASDVEQVQNSIRTLDKVLKDLAEVQGRVGALRKELGVHARGLRQDKPKGKPAEGSTRRLSDGREVFFDSGKWYILNEPPTQEKEE